MVGLKHSIFDFTPAIWDNDIVAICGVRLRKMACRVTDAWHTYTEVPAEIGADGSVLLSMEPCSFVLLEW
jgi:hypothetical protein